MELIPKLSLLPLFSCGSVPFRKCYLVLGSKQEILKVVPLRKNGEKNLVITKHHKVAHPITIGTREMVHMCSRPSVARALMARLPRLFRTYSWVPWEKCNRCRFGIIRVIFLFILKKVCRMYPLKSPR